MASADFTIDGNSLPGAVSTTYGATVDLALVSTSGVRTIAWSIVGVSASGTAEPTITPAGAPSGATASFAMPSDPGGGLGRSFLVECRINGGVDSEGTTQAAYTVRGIVGAPNDAGLIPVPVGEYLERDATQGWTDIFNAALAASGGGGSLTAPSNPADNNKVAIASAGDLTYALLANANVSASAAIAGTKISPDFGSQNVLTTGKLALGTSTLTILGGVTLPVASTLLSGSDSGGHGFVAEIFGAHAASANLIFSKSRGSKGSESQVSSSDQVLSIAGYARNASSAYTAAGAITLVANSVSGSSVPSTWAISTNGSTRVQVDVNGLAVTGGATVSGDYLTVGTTSARALGGAVAAGSGAILSTSLSGSGGGIVSENYSAATAGGALVFAKGRGGAKSDTPTAYNNGDELGSILGYGYTGSAWAEAWSIKGTASAAPSGSTARCDIVIKEIGSARLSLLDAAGTKTTQLHDLTTAGLTTHTSSGVLGTLAGSATGQTTVWNGSAWTAGALDLADSDAVTGLLPIANVAASGTDGQTLTTQSSATAWRWVGGAFKWSTNAISTATAARYLPSGGIAGTILSTDTDPWIATCAGYLRYLRVQQTAGTGSTTVTYTINVNGSNSALTCTIDNASTAETTDTTHTVTVADGDKVSLATTKAGTPSSGATNVTGTVLFIPAGT